jgi:hypothetical protein
MGYARSSLADALVLLVGLAAPGCSHTIVLDTSRLDVVPLGEFDAYMKDRGNPFADPEKRVVIRVPAGERIPLEFSLKVPFADLEGGPYAVRFRRDVFICLGRGTMLLGFDGRNFAAIDDVRGLKEVAGVESGKVEVGFGVKKSEGAKIAVGLEAH